MVSQNDFVLDYFVFRFAQAGWNIPMRTIQNHELVFITKGEGEIVLNGQRICIVPNTLLYFTPNQWHSIKTDTSLQFYGMHFSFAENQKNLEIPNVFQYDANPKIKQFFEELDTIHTQKQYLYEWKEHILLHQILVQIHLDLHQQSTPSDLQRVQKVIEYIHSVPYHTHTIAALCQQAGLKKSLFMQIFKQITGVSPLQYCIALKLAYAKDLLRENGHLSVQQIAQACGFSDPFYFSRLFKKHIGVSPQQFRTKDDF